MVERVMTMLDMVDVKKEIFEGSKRLDDASREIFKLAKKSAEAERDYRVALAKELIELKSSGMAVGMLQDVARGNVAELKFERDLAEEMYKAGRDSLRAIQSQLSALQSILRTQEEV